MRGGDARDYPDQVSVSEFGGSAASVFDATAAANGLFILSQQLGLPSENVCRMLSKNVTMWPMLNISNQGDIEEIRRTLDVLDSQDDGALC